MTLPHSSLGIALIAAVIAAFRSGIVAGLLPYTLSLRYPHIKKSGWFKSGECGDYCVTPAADQSVRETLL